MKLDPLEVNFVAKQYPQAHCEVCSDGFYILSKYKGPERIEVAILGHGKTVVKAWTNAYKNLTAPPKKKRGRPAKPENPSVE